MTYDDLIKKRSEVYLKYSIALSMAIQSGSLEAHQHAEEMGRQYFAIEKELKRARR